MGCISVPLIAAITDSIGGAGAALGAGAAGAAEASAEALGAAAAGGADAATTTALGTIAADNAATDAMFTAAAPELDAATTAGGFSSADIGGSFASLAATPAADFAGAAGALDAGVSGSTATAADMPAAGASTASGTVAPTTAATGAVPGAGAPAGSVAGAAAPAGAAAAPSATGEFGLGDSSLTGAGGGGGLTGSTVDSALGASSAPGLAAAPGAAAPTDVLGMLKAYGPLALGAGGLVSSILQGDKKPAYQGQVSAEAAQMSAQGQELQSYLTSGTLPPGVSAGLASANSSAAATIRSQYASRGQTGSSAEAQDLANLNATTVSQGAQIASNLLQQGVSENEFSAQLYQGLMDASVKQDAALSTSIANFAGGMAGMGLKSASTAGAVTP